MRTVAILDIDCVNLFGGLYRTDAVTHLTKHLTLFFIDGSCSKTSSLDHDHIQLLLFSLNKSATTLFAWSVTYAVEYNYNKIKPNKSAIKPQKRNENPEEGPRPKIREKKPARFLIVLFLVLYIYIQVQFFHLPLAVRPLS